MVTSIEYPDRFRVDADTPAGKVTQVYADGRYWIQDARGTNELPESARGQIQGNVQRDIVRVPPIRIEEEPAPGGGAAFRIELPAGPAT